MKSRPRERKIRARDAASTPERTAPGARPFDARREISREDIDWLLQAISRYAKATFFGDEVHFSDVGVETASYLHALFPEQQPSEQQVAEMVERLQHGVETGEARPDWEIALRRHATLKRIQPSLVKGDPLGSEAKTKVKQHVEHAFENVRNPVLAGVINRTAVSAGACELALFYMQAFPKESPLLLEQKDLDTVVKQINASKERGEWSYYIVQRSALRLLAPERAAAEPIDEQAWEQMRSLLDAFRNHTHEAHRWRDFIKYAYNMQVLAADRVSINANGEVVIENDDSMDNGMPLPERPGV